MANFEIRVAGAEDPSLVARPPGTEEGRTLVSSDGRISAMKLDDIGFYTLSDVRCAAASARSPLMRGEMIVTSRCNLRCPYCRRVGGPDMIWKDDLDALVFMAREGLVNLRLSGGEPTLWPSLTELVRCALNMGVQRVALSTNGTADRCLYEDLLGAGVSDFSVSLDACCASDGDMMAGGVTGAWERSIENIRFLAARSYTTVGVVLTEDNEPKVREIVKFAHDLGVADVRVIPAAQHGAALMVDPLDESLLSKHPILRYRWDRFVRGEPVRGLGPGDSKRCSLVLDDLAIAGRHHYPCIIYLREGGRPIGPVGPDMRASRKYWHLSHMPHSDPICSRNCLDVCKDYNSRYDELHLVPGDGR